MKNKLMISAIAVFTVVVVAGCSDKVKNVQEQKVSAIPVEVLEEKVVDSAEAMVEDVKHDAETMVEDVMGDVKEFTVTGKDFAFSTTEITVNNGDTVKINFESTQGFHDWTVDEFDAATKQVRPGTVTSVEFVATEAGTFEYYCSVGSHRADGMVGNLIVQ